MGFDLGYLRELAEDASERPGWLGLSDYFRFRHHGLRREALDALDGFMAGAVTWPLAERVVLSVWIGEKRMAYRGQPEAVLPVPLFRLLVRPTLDEWAAAAPDEPWPLVWLARLSSGGATWHAPPQPFLREALDRDPLFAPARLDLVVAVLADIAFHQHELPHAYLGEATQDLATLDEARRLLVGLDDDAVADLAPRIAWARSEALAWLEGAA
ncbi:hypothetical protein [Caulobacter hibisci]|uniref:DUF4020 domain-containing protein n=1 Tax=Caulobacter hibisci TaxID=2035993 RepID=A0ABS0T197_9CAUL|nr:hypothetical protein [Caulobacter hibisci]MBI1685643.1 hypothetical protein [Caulobacter hibisci]